MRHMQIFSSAAVGPPTRSATRKAFLTAAALLAVLFCTAGSVQAAIESFSFSYGPEGVPQVSHVVGNLPLFDPALGTLTEVDLTLTSTTSAGHIAFENTAGVPTDVTLGIGATVMVSGLGGLAATAVPLQIGSGSVTAFDGTLDYAGTSSFSVTGGTGTDSGTGSLTSGAVVPYIGVGTFAVNGTSSLQTFLSTSGGFGPTSPSAGVTSGTVSVAYIYTAVAPEPTSVVMFGVGAVGVLLAARRRRKS
jgi:hypothetical protein